MLPMNVTVERGDKERLQEIAEQLGAIAPGGRMKGMPSVSELFRQIASGRLRVEVADTPSLGKPEPSRNSNDMTPERAWSFVEAVWQASKNDVGAFRKTLVRMPTVTAIWPLDSDRVQELIGN